MEYVLRLSMDELTIVADCINQLSNVVKDNKEFENINRFIPNIMLKIQLALGKDKDFMEELRKANK